MLLPATLFAEAVWNCGLSYSFFYIIFNTLLKNLVPVPALQDGIKIID